MEYVLFVFGALLVVGVGVFLSVDARRVRRETERELVRERAVMREERAAHREETRDLLNRLAFHSGRPYEEAPIWARNRDGEGEEEPLIVYPESLVPVEFLVEPE